MKTTPMAPIVCKTAVSRLEVFKLRVQGLTFEQIGHRIGMSEETARRYVHKELEKIQVETREMGLILRDERLQDLAELMDTYLPLARTGCKKALDAVLKIMDRESRFLGMDAPTKTQEVLSTNPWEEMPLEQLREEAQRRGIPIQEAPESEQKLLGLAEPSKPPVIGGDD